MKIVIVIPARLASSRYPRKVLLDLNGLPMLEHARQRALMCPGISDVYVATCDDEIAKITSGFGGRVVMTSSDHSNGTSRVAEAIKNIDATHVILLQGDEPLVLPDHISALVASIREKKEIKAWNLVTNLEIKKDLSNESIVKCIIRDDKSIVFCFRKSPSISSYEIQKTFTKKMLGVMAFERKYLIELSLLEPDKLEISESIEQLRVVASDEILYSLEVSHGYPSLNEPSELNMVLEFLSSNIQKNVIRHYV